MVHIENLLATRDSNNGAADTAVFSTKYNTKASKYAYSGGVNS
jgi:hypothetical protein